jgi:AbrB family looped-hinge helix DNA binding protein
MKPKQLINAVRFTTQGRIVVPRHLRKKLRIETGTRAVIEATADGILIKPITRPYIARLRGSLKRNPNEKPFAERWAAHKREEHELEDR